MEEADENASKGLDELNKARAYQKSSGKCTYILVGIILICLIILGVILGFSSGSG